jgi:hypothetical protein
MKRPSFEDSVLGKALTSLLHLEVDSQLLRTSNVDADRTEDGAELPELRRIVGGEQNLHGLSVSQKTR